MGTTKTSEDMTRVSLMNGTEEPKVPTWIAGQIEALEQRGQAILAAEPVHSYNHEAYWVWSIEKQGDGKVVLNTFQRNGIFIMASQVAMTREELAKTFDYVDTYDRRKASMDFYDYQARKANDTV